MSLQATLLLTISVQIVLSSMSKLNTVDKYLTKSDIAIVNMKPDTNKNQAALPSHLV